jgi:hypothetical protein
MLPVPPAATPVVNCSAPLTLSVLVPKFVVPAVIVTVVTPLTVFAPNASVPPLSVIAPPTLSVPPLFPLSHVHVPALTPRLVTVFALFDPVCVKLPPLTLIAPTLNPFTPTVTVTPAGTVNANPTALSAPVNVSVPAVNVIAPLTVIVSAPLTANVPLVNVKLVAVKLPLVVTVDVDATFIAPYVANPPVVNVCGTPPANLIVSVFWFSVVPEKLTFPSNVHVAPAPDPVTVSLVNDAAPPTVMPPLPTFTTAPALSVNAPIVIRPTPVNVPLFVSVPVQFCVPSVTVLIVPKFVDPVVLTVRFPLVTASVA